MSYIACITAYVLLVNCFKLIYVSFFISFLLNIDKWMHVLKSLLNNILQL